ncbi:MAG: HigA family addiction module antidote protein [Alphaproteobacteria bacterium]|nr:HigA family addiction module antidote protein [Alphaproteobacteria bacterium]MCB9793034.1 HigA family addiction module antidote protein [Alphaproteobacteria bacterium]
MKKRPPIHPGEILKEEFLDPMGITPYRLAKSIDVPATRVHAILHGRRGISADTAIRLGLFFDVDPRWWLNMQASYELDVLEDQMEEIRASVTPAASLSS